MSEPICKCENPTKHAYGVLSCNLCHKLVYADIFRRRIAELEAQVEALTKDRDEWREAARLWKDDAMRDAFHVHDRPTLEDQ